MPLSDYQHHNEEALAIWWIEEGQHDDEPRLEYPDELDDGYECQDAPDECIAAGNFDQRKDGDPWHCSTCGHGPFKETEAGFVYDA